MISPGAFFLRGMNMCSATLRISSATSIVFVALSRLTFFLGVMDIRPCYGPERHSNTIMLYADSNQNASLPFARIIATNV